MDILRSENIAKTARLRALELAFKSKSPHIGSSLSIIDILTVIYSHYVDFSKINQRAHNRDRIILSKGHAALGFYAVMEQLNVISKELFETYCSPNSFLLGHVTHDEKKYVELSTGSLGHGLPYGIGIAISLKKRNQVDEDVIVIMSDGECDEGTTWESALIANHHKLTKLKVIIDRNFIQSIRGTEQTLSLEPLSKKWSSFGWKVVEIDGHSHSEIAGALELSSDKPTCIIARTTKGKGVSFMENNNVWHYRPPSENDLKNAIIELTKISQVKEK